MPQSSSFIANKNINLFSQCFISEALKTWLAICKEILWPKIYFDE